jgi:hypothetical protein
MLAWVMTGFGHGFFANCAVFCEAAIEMLTSPVSHANKRTCFMESCLLFLIGLFLPNQVKFPLEHSTSLVQRAEFELSKFGFGIDT